MVEKKFNVLKFFHLSKLYESGSAHGIDQKKECFFNDKKTYYTVQCSRVGPLIKYPVAGQLRYGYEFFILYQRLSNKAC